jgi:hypothetical protein
VFFDRQNAPGFSFPLYTTSLRRCPATLNRFSSSVLFFGARHRLIFMAALTSRITNPTRALPLVELINGGIPRTRTFCANTVSSLACRASTFSRLPLLFLFYYFTTCSFSLDGRRERILFRFFFRQPETPDPKIPYFRIHPFALNFHF